VRGAGRARARDRGRVVRARTADAARGRRARNVPRLRRSRGRAARTKEPPRPRVGRARAEGPRAEPEYVGLAYVKGAAAPRRPATCPACARARGHERSGAGKPVYRQARDAARVTGRGNWGPARRARRRAAGAITWRAGARGRGGGRLRSWRGRSAHPNREPVARRAAWRERVDDRAREGPRAQVVAREL
jgi:hypothetical protein